MEKSVFLTCLILSFAIQNSNQIGSSTTNQNRPPRQNFAGKFYSPFYFGAQPLSSLSRYYKTSSNLEGNKAVDVSM